MKPEIIVVMGVSGSGKTTIGGLLAERLGWDFFDGDDFHPPENVEKMGRGIPLSDADRRGWLEMLAGIIRSRLEEGKPAVVACSALKRAYRDLLRGGSGRVQFIHLEGSYDLIHSRMAARSGHYMSAGMLASQFATLEVPEDALGVDITPPPGEVVEGIVGALFPAG